MHLRNRDLLAVLDFVHEASTTVGGEDGFLLRCSRAWRIVPFHPFCRHQEETGDFSAMKLSDFLTQRRLHGSRRTPSGFACRGLNTSWRWRSRVRWRLEHGGGASSAQRLTEREREVVALADRKRFGEAIERYLAQRRSRSRSGRAPRAHRWLLLRLSGSQGEASMPDLAVPAPEQRGPPSSLF